MRIRRFERVAFASVENIADPDAVLDAIGRQLLPENEGWSVAQFSTLDEALLKPQRALREHRTLIVIDNFESILPDPSGMTPLGSGAAVKELMNLCQAFLDASEHTRLLFTSRQSLPAPFNRYGVRLGALSKRDAIDLVGAVLRAEGLTPKADDAGKNEAEIAALVEAVNRHARALVLIAREVAHRGITATTEQLDQVMADLDRRYPNDRENSLYANVELSLRRLPEDVQKHVPALAVFHGGVNLFALAIMWSGIDTKQVDPNSPDVASRFSQSLQDASQFALALVGVGLGELPHSGHLRVDPALPAYLHRTLTADYIEALQRKWGDAMEQLIAFLYEQQTQDTQLADDLTRLELPNLTAFLRWANAHRTPSEVIDLASRIETLVSELGIQRVLDEVVSLRTSATAHLDGLVWSRAHFTSESASIDRLLERGDLQGAYTTAHRLLERCLSEGKDAYAGDGSRLETSCRR